MSYQNGARTPLASLFTSLIVAVTLLFMTRLLYHTPLCVLAALVISAAFVLIDVQEPIYQYKKSRKCGFVMYFAVFGATLCFGPGIENMLLFRGLIKLISYSLS